MRLVVWLEHLGLSAALVFFFGACQSQVRSQESKDIEVQPSSLGEVVSGMDDEIWQVHQDRKGNYWFGSNGKGLYRHDGEQLWRYTTTDGLIDNAIRGIQEDHHGHLFIETPRGVSRFDGEVFISLTPNTSSSHDWRLEEHDLWFNCNGNLHEVYRYDGSHLYELALPRQDLNGAFGTAVVGVGFQGMNNSPYSVYGLNKDRQGHLWIGTVSAGAFRYDGEEFLWIGEKELSTLPDGRVPGVRVILEDKEGYFWMIHYESKYRILEGADGANYERLDVYIDSTQTDAFFNDGLVDEQGELWMVSYGNGLWNYDGTEWHHITVQVDGIEALVVSIFQDAQGLLWLGTTNMGALSYDGERFGRFELGASE